MIDKQITSLISALRDIFNLLNNHVSVMQIQQENVTVYIFLKMFCKYLE